MENFEHFKDIANALFENYGSGGDESGENNGSDYESNNCTTYFNLDEIDFTDPFASEPETILRNNVVIGVYVCICFVGLLANIGLILSLLVGGKKSTTFKTPSTILIVNLAIADSLLLLTLPFAIVQRWEDKWRFGFVFCKLDESLKFLSYYGSVFFLTAMAADRYFTIYRAKSYNRTRTRTKLILVSVLIWVLAILVDIPIMMFSTIDHRGKCNIAFPGTEIELPNLDDSGLEASGIELLPLLCLDDLPSMIGDEVFESSGSDLDSLDFYECRHHEAKSVSIWLTCNFIIGFVFPFAIISICYLNILVLKYSSSSSRPSNGNTIKQQNSNESSNSTIPSFSSMQTFPKTTNTIIFNKRAKRILDILIPCLILAFLICWLPYHIWHLIRINGVDVGRHPCLWIQDVTFILAFSNSAFNPIINSLFLFNFKNRLRKSASWLRKILKLKSKSSCDIHEVRFKKGNDQNSKSVGDITFIAQLD